MHKIAIIRITEGHYDGYDDYHNAVVHSITDWEEVSHEDFQLLRAAEYRYGYKVLEQITDLNIFIPKTIADYKKVLLKEQEEREAAEKKRKEAALAKKIKKEAKDKAGKLELFRKLQEELGDEVK